MMLRLPKQKQVSTIRSKYVIPTLLLFLLLGSVRTVNAQDSTNYEFWPEIDVYVHINDKVRLFFLGTVSKSIEDGEFRNSQAYEAQLGAHVDYIPNKHLVLRTGYRYGSSVRSTTILLRNIDS